MKLAFLAASQWGSQKMTPEFFGQRIATAYKPTVLAICNNFINLPATMTFTNNLIRAIQQEPALAMMVSQPPIGFHRSFVEITGSAMAALMLSTFLEIQENKESNHPDGWFTYDPHAIKSFSGMSRHEQKNANKILLAKSLLNERKNSVANVWEIRMDFDRISQALISAARFSKLAANKPVVKQMH